MSKSVTFSLSPVSQQNLQKPTSALTTSAVKTPDFSISKPQSTPKSMQNGPDEPAMPVAYRLSIGSKNHGAKSPVQAETGQLKMDNSDTSARPPIGFAINYNPKHKIQQSSTVNACVIAEKMRQQFNHTIHEHVQNVKLESASLHEHLLKVEDEIKLANKGKNALETAIQDMRRGISVNQQSISAQQKRRREEDSKSEMFREEAKTLFIAKRQLESHYYAMKHQIHLLDSVRKQIQSKLSTLSKSSEFDANRFKVYNGPHSRPIDGKLRHYSTASPQPPNPNHKEFLVTVAESIRASRNVRVVIKELITSAQTTKHQAHEKVTSAISLSIEKAKFNQRKICVEKGKLRLQQNAASNQAHKAEIAFGLVSGPISDKFKSVAESDDRPLMHSRPTSAIEESSYIKNTKDSLTRQISAAELRRSVLTSSSDRLSKSLAENSKHSALDSELMRVRKKSLDNRWVS